MQTHRKIKNVIRYVTDNLTNSSDSDDSDSFCKTNALKYNKLYLKSLLDKIV